MKCPYCDDGIVDDVIFPRYRLSWHGKEYIIRNAKLGICDACHRRVYDGRESVRWERITDRRDRWRRLVIRLRKLLRREM